MGIFEKGSPTFDPACFIGYHCSVSDILLSSIFLASPNYSFKYLGDKNILRRALMPMSDRFELCFLLGCYKSHKSRARWKIPKIFYQP